MGTFASLSQRLDASLALQEVAVGSEVVLRASKDGLCLRHVMLFGVCDEEAVWHIKQSAIGDRNHMLSAGDIAPCFGRRRCHKSTSELELAKCGGCGTKDWTLLYGKLCQDKCRNCVVRVNDTASVQHCTKGFETIYGIKWTRNNLLQLPTGTAQTLPEPTKSVSDEKRGDEEEDPVVFD